MISAFGVEHEVSKSLKPAHKDALMRVALDDDLMNWKRATYAHDRLALHGLQNKHKGKLELSSKYHKKGMKRLTRTRRSERDANRKPIFGAPGVAKSWVPNKGYLKAVDLSSQDRRAVKMGIKDKQIKSAQQQQIPGLGVSTKGNAPFSAQMARKEARRSKRVIRGQQVSPVRTR